MVLSSEMFNRGHVRPRPDGVKARCGGPGICKVCAAELANHLVPGAGRTGDESHRVAMWMTSKGYATGHGDTVEDMLGELEAQAKTRSDDCLYLRGRVRAMIALTEARLDAASPPSTHEEVINMLRMII